MQIVAIDTSGRHGSLAVLSGEADQAVILREVVLGGEQRTAQSLAPALRDLLAEASWPPRTTGLVAVTVGPGSFTGLRIGVTTAKAFAYAVGAEIIGVNTLDVLASQVTRAPSPLWAIMDAQRQELFAARFESNGADVIPMSQQTRIVPKDQWLAGLQAGERVTGPALRGLVLRLPVGVVATPNELWQPTAAAVGKLAWRSYYAGHRDDVWKLLPKYYRPSAAEEKRASKSNI
jgi:tRNA threonylcarbamoyladenosine biosynthesis protein TsaB